MKKESVQKIKQQKKKRKKKKDKQNSEILLYSYVVYLLLGTVN